MNKKQKALTIGATLFILVSVGFWFKPYYWADWVSGTVTEKISKTGDVPNKILVHLDDQDFVETLENKDIPSRMKWNSGDIQANLQAGEHYRFKVVGRRIRITSSYRNIVKYEKDER